MKFSVADVAWVIKLCQVFIYSGSLSFFCSAITNVIEKLPENHERTLLSGFFVGAMFFASYSLFVIDFMLTFLRFILTRKLVRWSTGESIVWEFIKEGFTLGPILQTIIAATYCMTLKNPNINVIVLCLNFLNSAVLVLDNIYYQKQVDENNTDEFTREYLYAILKGFLYHSYPGSFMQLRVLPPRFFERRFLRYELPRHFIFDSDDDFSTNSDLDDVDLDALAEELSLFSEDGYSSYDSSLDDELEFRL
uniref:Transmembrane protein n=1 Tax=Parastrongyloides trichosuri TaxID=131310 RepID=A0A0N4ZBX1_PARTI